MGIRDTIKAAKTVVARDLKNSATPDDPTRTQGAVADRHIRQHTPDRLYGEDADPVDEE
ncbi:hypothetical protein ACIO8F_07910 [Streptomyces sp. NPDC087228]|uniref:hypothetical protein n=1 Tax=Streptomyces sp. NPDC087228 TaxID=3365772 RepID=UPI00381703A4